MVKHFNCVKKRNFVAYFLREVDIGEMSMDVGADDMKSGLYDVMGCMKV